MEEENGKIILIKNTDCGFTTFDKESKIIIIDSLLRLLTVFSRGKKCLIQIIKKHKKQLLVSLFFLTVFVGIVGAIVYSSMYMQSNIGVEAILIFSNK